MAFNLLKDLLGVKRGQQAENVVDTAGSALLSTVAPGISGVISAINTFKGTLGSTTTVSTVAATVITIAESDLDKLLNAGLTAMNNRLTAAGLSPVLETEFDADVVNIVHTLETEGVAAAEKALGIPDTTAEQSA